MTPARRGGWPTRSRTTRRASPDWKLRRRRTRPPEKLPAPLRPELLPACVALYAHPQDPRYQGIIGGRATVPIFGQQVPVRADDGVDPDLGTGLMMVCTFGDGEDVARWRRDGLELRLVVTGDGRLGPPAGEYAGMPLDRARKAILAGLAEVGALVGDGAYLPDPAPGVGADDLAPLRGGDGATEEPPRIRRLPGRGGGHDQRRPPPPSGPTEDRSGFLGRSRADHPQPARISSGHSACNAVPPDRCARGWGRSRGCE